MKLNPLNTELSLLSIFQRLQGTDETLACISGFGTNWCNLLAFDSCESFQLSDVKDLDKLHEFVSRHEGNLIVGYFSYDLGLALQGIKSQFDHQQPLIQLHAYERFITEENNQVSGYRLQQQDFAQLQLDNNSNVSQQPSLNWHNGISLEDYLTGFDKIQNYIRAGDIYQINYTHQLGCETDMKGKDLFAYYMTHKPVSHAAYFASNEMEIISLSPEGFIAVEDKKIITQPIKGTRPRGSDDEDDLNLREQLITSEKEQAELFMIVDLLRNDLGKVCDTGTVRVVDPKIVTAMPNVWHTHATIQGQLKQTVSLMDALISMFPGGSITGCPKRRAMEIIDELESSARGIYTGSIGYILPTGQSAFNIAIRTMIKTGKQIKLGVGGGITIKSDGAEEYAETAAKAAFFRS